MPYEYLPEGGRAGHLGLSPVVHGHPRIDVVQLFGELDLFTAPQASWALRTAAVRVPVLVVDLRAVEFIDVVGLHVVLDASAEARRSRRRIIVVRPPAPVDRIFALTDAVELIELVELAPAEPPERALAFVGVRSSEATKPPRPTDLRDVRARSLTAFRRRVQQEVDARDEARLRAHLQIVIPKDVATLSAADELEHLQEPA